MTKIKLPLIGNISVVQKILLTKHLAMMLKTGLPITKAYEIIATQTNSPAFKKALNNIKDKLDKGSTLHEALREYPEYYSEFYVSIIEVGEETGTLVENLEFLTTQLEKDYDLKKKIQAALTYPIFVFVAAMVIGLFIAIVIFPQLLGYFESLDFELPLPTKILMFIATVTSTHGILIVLGSIISLITFSLLVQIKPIKRVWHKFLLSLPYFGKIIKYSQLGAFCRNLKILLDKGVPIDQAIAKTQNTLQNLIFYNLIEKAKPKIQQGKYVSTSLHQLKTKLIPEIMTEMIKVGEDTGNLTQSLEHLSGFFEKEIDSMIKNLTSVLEPIFLIIIGIMVGFIAIAVIAPIYQFTGSISI